MADNNQIAKPEFKTSLIKIQDKYLGMIEGQMSDHRITLDPYQKNCVLNAISAIGAVMDKTGISFAHEDVDQSSITQILLTVAALRLNASATPREVYFQVRNTKKIIRNPKDLSQTSEAWMKVVEMGIEGDGNDAMLRNFGAGIKKVGQYWTVREHDEFTPPRYKGMTVEPPTWVPKGMSNRVLAVVYPIVKDDGAEEYYISYRADVKANLIAHISNNLMNECFGIAVNRYKATPEQKVKIDAAKQKIIDGAAEKTLDEILDDESLAAYISPAWREPQSRELMIIRKMRNNIVKKIPKDFQNGFAAGQYEGKAADDDEITKDAGGDLEALPEPPTAVIDITPADIVAEAPAPPVTPVEAVKPPKTRPQPTPQQEPREVSDADQLGF